MSVAATPLHVQLSIRALQLRSLLHVLQKGTGHLCQRALSACLASCGSLLSNAGEQAGRAYFLRKHLDVPVAGSRMHIFLLCMCLPAEARAVAASKAANAACCMHAHGTRTQLDASLAGTRRGCRVACMSCVHDCAWCMNIPFWDMLE